ncbi:hypothetical protein MTR67_034387 [Solanum verrucosum]|uniref:DC1 domain-containing protein n=1 Tax=Solanum verrucosum TaxID=315347 RepID=A0AAF0U811_SOLVR|nr:hypothetical protein MTR67_034387 [Solanum verrucosum]
MVVIVVITFFMRYALTFLKEFDMIFILCTHSPFFPFLQSLFGIRIVETEFCCVASGYDNSCPHNTLFSFYYHCDLCKFDLHLECASVTTKLIHKKSLLLQKTYPGQQQKQGQLGEVTHFSHRHPLKAIKQTNEASIMSCCICSSQALSCYICQLCNYFIDETCFPLP